MALDDKRLDQGADDSKGATDVDQSKLSKSTEGDTKPDSKGSDSWELSINGKPQNFTQEELVEYVQKGLDYTQKNQVLAEERKRFEPYKDFATKMETNSEFRDAVVEVVTDFESRELNQSTDGATDPKLLAKLNFLEQQLTTMAMSTKFDALEKKYGDVVDRTKISAYATANGITDPEIAFFMLNKDSLIESAKNEGIEIGKKGGSDKVLVTRGKPGLKAPKEVDTKNMSKGDKKARAIGLLKSLTT